MQINMEEKSENASFPHVIAEEEKLKKDYQKFKKAERDIYFGALLYLLTSFCVLGLIFRYESPNHESLTALGWLELISWFAVVSYSFYYFNKRKGFFSLLDEWQSLLEGRKRDLEYLAAHRAGEPIYKRDNKGVYRPVEERGGVLVTKSTEEEHNRKP
jgi:hypothetical protein